ncbi:MAG TPA: mechanosensitive ion channel domain-containing protein [Noviherbaspirillum sp.]|uniref:mechanosensitive ion channel family protein n=1 Tax=Noviherbaspirillum sp. TaxID=1926288 RepID=UPI002D5C65DF|nr:mechanosensitive ion channel domain-containing protein [Noviherbaspirillum sp.]HYD94045.1 mechanosensitive ion channel domain-containing protein [Noviherbaspirillum sp.]
MKQTLLSSLITDLWSDLRDPGLLWQLSALTACLVLGWALGRILRGRLTAHDVQMRVMRLGVESFSRVLVPLVTLALIAVAKLLLQQSQNVNLLRVAIPLVGSFALIRLAFYVLRRIFARGGNAGSFLVTFEKVFATLVWCGVALYITGMWTDLLEYLDQVVLPVGRHKVSLLVIAQAALSVLVTLVVALWGGAVLEERLMRMDSVHSSLRAVAARLGRAILILLAVLISLSLVGIDLTVLSVFGGALGVGLGLGLQKIVSSYVSGFVVLLERSLTIGDVVTVDKYSGQITQINTRYTVLRGGDGIETVIPNEMLLSGTVQNYSLSDRILRLSTRVTVAYKSDVDLVLALLIDAAASVDRVLKDPAPHAFLMRFDADGFEMELGWWIADPENGRSNVLSDVNRAVWKNLQEHRIEVPYPQREIRLLDLPPAVENRVSRAMRATETQ